MPTTSPGLSRNQRSRQRMRLKLVDAARRVMARKGIEAATINEITEEADVGFGSFYNYFKTKEELARAVFVAQNLELGEQFDLLNLNVHDPRQKLSRNILRGAERLARIRCSAGSSCMRLRPFRTSGGVLGPHDDEF